VIAGDEGGGVHGGELTLGNGRKEELFFFEKKNQKTFAT
jgi:hypothetical protein